MSKFNNFKDKVKNNYYKAKIFATNPKTVAMLLPALKAAKRKDYREALTIISQNPDIQDFIMNNEDKIKSILMRYGGEIRYILETIDSMKQFNQVYHNDTN